MSERRNYRKRLHSTITDEAPRRTSRTAVPNRRYNDENIANNETLAIPIAIPIATRYVEPRGILTSLPRDTSTTVVINNGNSIEVPTLLLPPPNNIELESPDDEENYHGEEDVENDNVMNVDNNVMDVDNNDIINNYSNNNDIDNIVLQNNIALNIQAFDINFNYKFCGKCCEYKLTKCSNNELCDKCIDEKVIPPDIIYKLSYLNDMNPFQSQNELGNIAYRQLINNFGKLSHIEEQFLSRNQNFMKVYYLKSCNNLRYAGSCINFVKSNMKDLFNRFPVKINELGLLFIKKDKIKLNVTQSKLFSVNGSRLVAYLNFYRAFNPLYSDCIIDTAELEELSQVETNTYNNINILLSPSIDLRILEDNALNNLPQDLSNIRNSGAADEGHNHSLNENVDDIETTTVINENVDITRHEQDVISTLIHRPIVPVDNTVSIPNIDVNQTPINEYDCCNLFAATYPSLFPFGIGDITNHNRVKEVTLIEMIHHLMWYAVFDPCINGYIYPFIHHPTCIAYMYDVYVRKLTMSKVSIFVSKSNEFSHNNINNINLRVLHDTIINNNRNRIETTNNHENDNNNNNNTNLFNIDHLLKSCTSFLKDVNGSPSNLDYSKNITTELMNQYGAAQFFFTASIGSYHLYHLWKLLPPIPVNIQDNIEEIRKWKTHILKDYEHVVNDYFQKKLKCFISNIFGPSFLNGLWYMYRIEFSKRAAGPHAHGLLSIKNGPDISKLLKKIYAYRKLKRNYDGFYCAVNNVLPGDYHQFNTISSKYDEDNYVINFNDVVESHRGHDMFQYEGHNITTDQLSEVVDVGIRAEIELVKSINQYVSRENLSNSQNMPTDYDNDKRNDPLPHPNPHPCETISNVTGRCDEDLSAAFHNACHRHHHTAYCLRKDEKCRFNYPKKIAIETVIVIEEIPYITENIKLIKKIRYTIKYRSNDRWATPRNLFLSEAWNSSLDLQVTIDVTEILHYILSYALKVDKNSNTFNKIFENQILEYHNNNHSVNESNIKLSTILKSCAIQSQNSSEKSISEIFWLAAGYKIVEYSHVPQNIRLLGDNLSVTVNEDAITIHKNMNVLYSLRDDDKYYPFSEYNNSMSTIKKQEYKNKIMSYNFYTFINIYYATKVKDGFSRHKKPTIVMVTPKYGHKIGSMNYYLYCLCSLLKYKVYIGDIKSVLIDDIPILEYTYDITNLRYTPEETALIPTFVNVIHTDLKIYIETRIGRFRCIYLWEKYYQYIKDKRYLCLLSQINRIEDIQDLVDSNLMDDIDIEEEELLTSDSAIGLNTYLRDTSNLLAGFINGEETQEVDIDLSHNFSIACHQYHNVIDDLIVETFRTKFKAFETTSLLSSKVRNQVPYASLNIKQKIAHNIITECVKNNSRITRNKKPLCAIVSGSAGCGKSYLIDSIIHTLTTNNIQYLLAAPTGSAAVLIGGVTLHKLFCLPVEKENLPKINSNKLKEYIDQFSKIELVIIDEMSMLSMSNLVHINSRLQQFKNNTILFGGVSLVLLGDYGQLPPVTGKPIYLDNIKDAGKYKQCITLYREFTTVIILTKQCRVVASETRFKNILAGIKMGTLTVEEYNWFHQQVYIGNADEETKLRFSNVLTIYPTSKEVNDANCVALKNMNMPILLINAIFSSDSRPKITEKLQIVDKLYICVNAYVRLVYNLCTDLGLVNGSKGRIKDIIYLNSNSNNNNNFNNNDINTIRPTLIIVEFEDYIGPIFFNNYNDEDRSKWVPIFPISLRFNNNRDTIENFPLQLSWSCTIHKSQGMTMKGPYKGSLGEKESSSGMSYTLLSRATSIQNLKVVKSFSYERISLAITKSKVFTMKMAAIKALEHNEITTLNSYKSYPSMRNLINKNSGKAIDDVD